MTTYTEHSPFTEAQLRELTRAAESQNEVILSILRADVSRGWAIFQMIDYTGIHYSSVNRALSSMSSRSGRAAKRFMDSCGRMPVIRREDETVYNPDTGKNVSTYWYNVDYEKPCGQSELDL